MRLGSSTDKKDSGRLHVDFAQARDDFYEWECRQRMRAREERHRRKLEEDRLRPPSPPAIMHYSEHEAALLAEKLKGRRPAGGWGAPPPPMRARPPTGSGRRPPTCARPGRFSRAFTCRPRGEQVAWRRDTPASWDRVLPLPSASPPLSVRGRVLCAPRADAGQGQEGRQVLAVTRAPRRPHLRQVLTRRRPWRGDRRNVSEEGPCLRRWS